jgi:hypothetical protein
MTRYAGVITPRAAAQLRIEWLILADDLGVAGDYPYLRDNQCSNERTFFKFTLGCGRASL